MKKVLKGIILVLIIVILCMVAIFMRRYIILAKLDKMVANLEDTKDNIYMKVVDSGEEHSEQTSEVFIKGDVEKSVVQWKNQSQEMMIICYPNETKIYTEVDGKKAMSIREGENPKRTSDINAAETTHTVIPNFAHTTTIGERIKLAMSVKIKTTEIDGKKCYDVYGLNMPMFLYDENAVDMHVYSDKETGLLVKMIETVEKEGKKIDYSMTYEFKFDTVTDEDIAEPDVSEYEVINN